MTRKHFNALAVALAHVRPEMQTTEPDTAADGWLAAVDAVADVCRASNPRFDRAKFVDACSVWDTKIQGGELRKAS